MYACVGRWAVWERVRRWHGPGGWRLGRGRRPRRSPAGRDSSSRPPDRSANQFALAKRGENSRFAKAMRSEGDERDCLLEKEGKGDFQRGNVFNGGDLDEIGCFP